MLLLSIYHEVFLLICHWSSQQSVCGLVDGLEVINGVSSTFSAVSYKFDWFLMGNDVTGVQERLPSARTKAHVQTCSELLKLVIMVTKIFPEIEAARPRCSSGIEALCQLNKGIITAKSLLQHCSESSVLYLALTGDAIVSKCKKLRNLWEQSLAEIQNMVPVVLAAKISGIIADLRSAAFCLDPPEEEAGKVLRELLQRYSTIDSPEDAAISVIQSVSSWLHITSRKALLIEKKSIRKLLDKLGESEQSKRKILLFFLDLLSKYGKFIAIEQKHDGLAEHEEPPSPASPYGVSGSEGEFRLNFRSDEAQIDMFNSPVPPDEFICPLTSRLMYDPVTIASGHTYERTWIRKWFDEGNDNCPKTETKLENLSVTSNTVIKEQILKWCATHGVLIFESDVQDASAKPWEASTNSITSLSSSMNDLNLPFDFKNLSFKSSLISCPSHVKTLGSVKSSREVDVEFFTKFSSLPWESQCNAVEDVKRLYETNCASWSMVPPKEFVQLLLRFLKDALDFCDIEAQMSGCVLLLEFVQKDRNSMMYLDVDSYGTLASFLDTKVVKQALALLEALSFHRHCGSKFAASGALIRMLNILDSSSRELLEPALKILSNLSKDRDLGFSITPSEIVAKLVRLLEDDTLARYCIITLKNLCDIEEARVSIAEATGCISAVAKLLENENRDVQECAVSILHSLLTKHALYRELVMNEVVVPGLFHVSMNGNERAKAMAIEILRIPSEESDSAGENSGSHDTEDSTKSCNPPSRTLGLFGKIFSKRSAKSKKLNFNS